MRRDPSTFEICLGTFSPDIFFLFFFFHAGVDLGEAWSLRCRGIVYGIIGKIQFFPGKFFHPPVLNFYYVYFFKSNLAILVSSSII